MPNVSAVTRRTGEILAAVEDAPDSIVLHVPPSPSRTEFGQTAELALEPSEARALGRELLRAAGDERFVLVDDVGAVITAEDLALAAGRVLGRTVRGGW